MAAEAGRAVLDLVRLLWGSDVKPEVFQRWNQGFVFGPDEPTALLQYDGGPCAVIVPVQAFLLKHLLFSGAKNPTDAWRQTNGSLLDHVLISALCDILCRAAGSMSSHVVLCDEASGSASIDVQPAVGPASAGHFTQFHADLREKQILNGASLQTEIERWLPSLHGPHGVLLFLYSVILTRGLTAIRADIADTEDPMIDTVHGHGSQSLINLLLTGRAVSHVWDNVKDVSGLKLQGIMAQSEIGFLTLLEHLRYCEVGWYLKNPRYPIWLLASETHLTILFSQDRSLVSGEESQDGRVRRVFSTFDQEGRGFVSTDSLRDLMTRLDLVSDPDYVRIMAEKLDPEQLGVITLGAFIDEFYPELTAAASDNIPKSFVVYHYNGLQRSNNGKVRYAEGTCSLPDMPELQMISDFSPIKTCLLTKWPTIELSWTEGVIPSMN